MERNLSQSGSQSPELSPLDIGEDFVPVRVPKQAGQTEVDFDGLLTPALKLHEDLREGCGGQLWPAGVVLGRHLLQNLEYLAGKIIARCRWRLNRVQLKEQSPSLILISSLHDLTESTSLALALALDRLSKRTEYPLLITDLPQLLPLQEQNIRLNGLRSDTLTSASFPWGGKIPDTIPTEYHSPDIVLAADCVYYEPAFPLLLETMHALIDQDRRDTVCFFCMKKRRKADMRFVAALKKGFLVEPIVFKPENGEERNVYL